jgi:ubiquinone biosynthesis protein
VLLQKTLLNIEGLGRDLDPDLDLWKTAKPYLERWMAEQIGWRGLLRHIREEAPQWGVLLPQLPRLIHKTLSAPRDAELRRATDALLAGQLRRNRILVGIFALLAAMLAFQLYLGLS